jgi:N-methylhydantoinase A
MRIGIDAGGTFTDFVVLAEDGALTSFKLRSNPNDPAAVILEGIRRASLPAGQKKNGRKPEVIHGSTVATNALLERKGARVALVTTAGFEDVVFIGRQNRPELYNLTPLARKPLLAREMSFGVRERTFFDGTIAEEPRVAELRRLKAELRRAGVESVAICFLHSYSRPENERAALEALGGDWYLCASHEISPEFREFERTSTTVVNAYVGPLMQRYLAKLGDGRIEIMQSNGGLISASDAARHAVRTILSGPAGGVIGAAGAARLSGFTKVLGFDMGGTSTDVALTDGEPKQTTEATVDGFPIRVPMLDIHTVGAGGGSLARIDAGGMLRVGPESAGADPGPACYGKGVEAAVTDAHVVLGRLDTLLGGEMPLDQARAEAAVARVAEPLGLKVDEAAAGILQVANASMERAIRVVSVERGHDPREFALVAFGGCGGLHACDLAEALAIPVVLVPQYAGALSALGMLMADRVRDYAAGVLGQEKQIEKRFRDLEKQARRELRGAELERFADLRYAGQSYELTVPWRAEDPGAAFHAEHQRLYGYADAARRIEVVTVRVRARVTVERPRLKRPPVLKGSGSARRIWVSGAWREIAVAAREAVGTRAQQGPALVLDYGSTTLVNAGWSYAVDASGALVLRRES